MTAAGELLNEIEALLVEYRAAQAPLRVEVVAHGDGLDVLRTQLSAHRARVQAMADHYQNLTFVACQNTIDRLQVEQGVEVVLLPQARLTESGVDHVVRRQQQGWVYIRV
jgi:intracellular sulfur oxidation DsrE/DsrF family protein